MAITGQGMVLFTIVHLLGNSSIFAGPNGINSYAEHLHSLGPVVWIFRLAMLALLSIHVIFGITLTVENSKANPAGYAVSRKVRANFSSENMIWTGLILLCFIVYHLLHFTVRVTPGLVQTVDQMGRFNVFAMVTNSFQKGGTAFIYIAAMVALFLHLKHGIQSFFQTMGWSSDKSQPAIIKVGVVASVILLVGYASIPLFILTGILKG